MLTIPLPPVSRFLRSPLIPLLAASLLGSLQADVRLHGLFSDNMVLQRGRPIPVWGWADEGEKITVEFRGAKRSTTAHHGRWKVLLPVQKTGGPDTLTVRGKNLLSLTNVLVGEVWIASGQSNMEWPLRASHDATNAIAAATHPQLRLFTVPKLKSQTPVDDVKSAWVECTPDTVPGFSAVAYYFGLDLHRSLGVPIGLINTSWGGSPAEVWMSHDTLAATPRYRQEILEPAPAQWQRFEDQQAAWEKETADLKAQGKQQTKAKPRAPWRPSELYNGMIAPLIPFSFRGAIWYQGESNASRAHQYRTLFPDMISNWRRAWGQGDFTFLAVQLAPYMKTQADPKESAWAELREAQWLATRALPNVGVAVITDVGDQNDIHPRKKQPVGARLALAARHLAYRQNIPWSGPQFSRLTIKNHQAILSFSHVYGGLVARNGDLRGFTIAGPDRKFVWANAYLDGRRVVVSNPEVPHPVAVRYGWADYPEVNLWNVHGLPATPFRTDHFPMTTAPKPPQP